jgi:hypothetical protein
VEDPVPCPLAFRQRDRSSLLSQAAFLLVLGERIRGEGRMDAVATTEAARRIDPGSGVGSDDEGSFPIPALRPGGLTLGVEMFGPRGERPRAGPLGLGPFGTRLPRVAPHTLAESVFADPTPDRAAQLIASCQIGRPELVTVAATIAGFEFHPAPELALDLLARAATSDDALASAVAVTGLARLAPRHPALRPPPDLGDAVAEGEPSHTTVLVHGTWGAGSRWWRPGGDFHTYLKGGPIPDVYGAPDRFQWSGQYHHSDRVVAALLLGRWAKARGMVPLDLVGHSHGANVALLANMNGLQVGRLILLSCPVHWDRYHPAFSRVRRVVSIRARMDLVVLADGGRQRFPDDRVVDRVLPVWFDHFASRSPRVWDRYSVPTLI